MRTKHIIPALLLTLAALVSCETQPVGPVAPANGDVQRTVVYTIGVQEGTKNPKTDAEWDELLDQFCNYAEQGEQVAFYSMTTSPGTAKAIRKEKTTFTTTDREEIKAWMKSMEKAGKTVNVNYNEETGVWTGVAYAGAGNRNVHDGQAHTGTLVMAPPPSLDGVDPDARLWALQTADSTLYLALEGYLLEVGYIMGDMGLDFAENETITLYGQVSVKTDLDGTGFYVLELNTIDQESLAGKWKLADLYKVVMSYADEYPELTAYMWDDNGVPAYYNLLPDGTAVFTQGSESASGSWSLSHGGQLCCDIFEGCECWTINWCSAETLVLSCEDFSSTEEQVYYQMMLTADH